MARRAIENARIATDRVLEEERNLKEGGLQAREIERREKVELAGNCDRPRPKEQGGSGAVPPRIRRKRKRSRGGTRVTPRETEMAERRKQIELIEASKEAQPEDPADDGG